MPLLDCGVFLISPLLSPIWTGCDASRASFIAWFSSSSDIALALKVSRGLSPMSVVCAGDEPSELGDGRFLTNLTGFPLPIDGRLMPIRPVSVSY